MSLNNGQKVMINSGEHAGQIGHIKSVVLVGGTVTAYLVELSSGVVRALYFEPEAVTAFKTLETYPRPKFKEGDKVRVLYGEGAGETGTIERAISKLNEGETFIYLVKLGFAMGRQATADQLELVERKEPKVGDRMRVIKKTGPNAGMEGTVTAVKTGSNGNIIRVELERGTVNPKWSNYFYEDEIEVIDPAPVETKEPVVGGEIEFDQIRRGDKIRTVREFEDGFTLTMEGVADRHRSDGSWISAGDKGHVVAPKDLGTLATKQHHILVEREEPKNWFVFSRYVLSGSVSVQTLSGKTEKEAKELAAEWTKEHANKCGERPVYWAAQA
jgi:ribosomal protein L24